ncbi:MAG: SPOR domain-containing protein [Proteobacteria bacterium]|nr:SPOR domain-containing protein [Pseudomonadota bacterium]
MSAAKPASLDGSLLARKGDAAPAISHNSPLLEELGEPRLSQPGGPYGTGMPRAGAGSGALGLIGGLIGQGLTWLASHPVFGVLGLAVGIAILFGVTIVALTPSPDAVPQPEPAAPAVSVVAPEKIMVPSEAKSMTEPPEKEAAAAITEPETIVALPDPTETTVMPPEPPVKATIAPAVKPRATAVPSGQSGRYLLQLSAVPTAKSARVELARLKKRLGGILGNRKIIVVRAVPRGKPPVYRLRASAYESFGAARAACKQIKKRKMDCLVVRR